jgi:hypothetical protein
MVGRRGAAAAVACAFALLIAVDVRAQAGPVPPPIAAGAGQALAIQAPQVLVLGRDAHAIVRFNAPDAAHVRLYANIGSLGAPREVATGRFEVEYTPPEEKYPQVAILALLSDDASRLAWTQIALHGTARVELRSEPEASVEVHVGDAVFGPVKTDPEGRAIIPVIVPPGTVDALSIATDALGNQRQQSIPIVVPEFQRLLSVCSDQDARGFWVFAVDAHGAPQRDAALETSAAPLQVSGTSAAAPGVYRIALTIPGQVHTGDLAQLRAKLREQSVAPQVCELRVELARAESLALTFTRSSDTAHGVQPIRVQVAPSYRTARVPEALELSFSASLGRVEPEHARSSGPIEVLWWLPKDTGELAKATFNARAGDLLASGAIELEGGANAPPKGLVLGAQLGVISNFAKVTGPLVAVQIAHALPFISPRLQLAFECGYYQSMHSDLTIDGSARVETTLRGVPSLLRFAYRLPLGRRFELWPFAGAGVLVALSEVASTASGKLSASQATPLWAAGGGAGMSLGPGRIALELGYADGRISAPSVSGNAAGFFAALGYALGR